MPTPIPTLLPPTPIQKSAPPKPATDAPNNRDQDFQQALKTATKRASEQTQSTPKKSKPEKVAKEKTAAKPANKTSKSKTDPSQPQDTDPTDESPDTQTARTAAAAQPQAELPVEEEVQTEPQAKPKSSADAKTNPDHPEQDAAVANAAAAQTVQPIKPDKDQHPDHPDHPEQEEQPDEHTQEHPKQSAPTIQEIKRDTSVRIPLAGGKPAPIEKTKLTDNPNAVAAAQAGATDDAQPQPATAQSTTTTTPVPVADKATSENPVIPAPQVNQSARKTTNPDPAVAPLDADEGISIQPRAKTSSTAKSTDTAADSSISAATAFAQLTSADPSAAPSKPAEKSDPAPDPTALIAPDAIAPHATQSNTAAPAVANTPAPAPEIDFAQTNHAKIVSEVQGQLLPHGGTMEIRLDPPELGALKVMVEMRDGVMNATFQTSNENATQLLSHSLNQLKHVLESQGVSVERLQVQQAPKSEHASPQNDEGQQQQRDANDQHTAQQEQQRKELLRRMWRKVSGAGDPVDYFA